MIGLLQQKKTRPNDIGTARSVHAANSCNAYDFASRQNHHSPADYEESRPKRAKSQCPWSLEYTPDSPLTLAGMTGLVPTPS